MQIHVAALTHPHSPQEFSPDALSAQAFRQKILVKSTTPKECGLLAFDWYSLFQQNLNSVENIVNNLLWHFQTEHVCRTCRVTEAICFKTNNGSCFQNHKVTLSVLHSAVCQAAAPKHNQPLVTTCLTMMPRNYGFPGARCIIGPISCLTELPIPQGCLQTGIWGQLKLQKQKPSTEACFGSHAPCTFLSKTGAHFPRPSYCLSSGSFLPISL